MTFRIFSDDARKKIADHIIGAPPEVHNRQGRYLGTDVHMPQNIEPPCYGSTCYKPGPGCVGSTCPEQKTPDPYIDCDGGVPADHGGNCHNGMILRKDRNGNPYCCPGTRISVIPPTSPGAACGPGSSITFAKTNFSSMPAFDASAASKTCHDANGIFHVNTTADVAFCCTPKKQEYKKPPNTTPTPVAPVYPDKPRASDGAPAIPGVSIARTVNDIAAGAIGLGYLTSFSPGSGQSGANATCEYTTAQGFDVTAATRVGGDISKADCKKDSPAEGTLRVKYTKIYNPGSATIPVNTNIIVAPLAVFAPKDTWCAIVVPCTT